MSNCGEFSHELMLFGNESVLKKIVVVKATIDSIDRPNNTADITLDTTCESASIPTEAVEFFYHCQYSDGSSDALMDGNKAFLEDDEVYVFHIPEIVEGEGAKTYIVGHADIPNVKPCTGEYICARIKLFRRTNTFTVPDEYTWVTVFDSLTGELVERTVLVDEEEVDVTFPVRCDDLPTEYIELFVPAVIPPSVVSPLTWPYHEFLEDEQTGFPWEKQQIVAVTGTETYSEDTVSVDMFYESRRGITISSSNVERDFWDGGDYIYGRVSSATTAFPDDIDKSRYSLYYAQTPWYTYNIRFYQFQAVGLIEVEQYPFSFIMPTSGRQVYVRRDDSSVDGYHLKYIDSYGAVGSYQYYGDEISVTEGTEYSVNFSSTVANHKMKAPWLSAPFTDHDVNSVSEQYGNPSELLYMSDYEFIANSWVVMGEYGMYGYAVHVSCTDALEGPPSAVTTFDFSNSHVDAIGVGVNFTEDITDETITISSFNTDGYPLPVGPIRDLIDFFLEEHEANCTSAEYSPQDYNDFWVDIDFMVLKEVPV